jgi:hypothetical protein
MFARENIEVKRLALNMEQVERYAPPPNPAKDTDARFVAYEYEFGNESWELDALDPPVIEKLIQDALDAVIDQSEWDASIDAEDDSRKHLAMAASRWEEVTAWLDNQEETP